MRLAGAARGNDEICRATFGREPDEVGTSGDAEIKRAVVAVVGVPAQSDDAVAVGRPRGITVESGGFRELLRSAASRRHFPNLAAPGRPGDIGDLLTVGRPNRLKFL